MLECVGGPCHGQTFAMTTDAAILTIPVMPCREDAGGWSAAVYRREGDRLVYVETRPAERAPF